jgi:hypothetical protein
VTRRPSPRGRRERSVRTQKDDETDEGTLVFRKTPSFAGGRGNEGLGQHASQASRSLKRSHDARRGGGHSKSFAATGWRHKGARQGNEEGHSRNARVLHSALSARMGSCGQPRWRQRVCALCRIDLARCGWPAQKWTAFTQTQERRSPRERLTFPMRARMMALEGVPVRRI